ncbi:MAG: hypothetical protein ACHQE5_04730 [Actinomycetes bacterium]
MYVPGDTGVETRVLRPAAVLDHRVAARLLAELERMDVSLGGLWAASASLWQRYDQPWNGPGGARGTSLLVGSIGVMYDAPARQQITLYRVTLTEAGQALGFTVDKICDDALSWVGMTLAQCPRAELATAPAADPFRRR